MVPGKVLRNIRKENKDALTFKYDVLHWHTDPLRLKRSTLIVEIISQYIQILSHAVAHIKPL